MLTTNDVKKQLLQLYDNFWMLANCANSCEKIVFYGHIVVSASLLAISVKHTFYIHAQSYLKGISSIHM